MKNIMAFVLMIVSAGVFYVYIGPTYQEIQSQLAVKSKYDGALNDSQKILGLRSELLDKYNSFSPTDIKKLEILLPSYVDNIRLIIELDGIASAKGARLKNVIFPDGINGGSLAQPNTQTGETLEVSRPSNVGTAPIGFTVVSTYENYQMFLKSLSESLRLIDVTEVSFAPPSDGSNLFEFKTAINTYYFKRP